VAAEELGEGVMCCRAVLSGWVPAVGQGSPGETHEVRMGSG